ncbi:MAG: SirB2 family protein [Xanthomonadales bacterium]|nr:SirB2 family protein [Xanthomonadales bacterium]MCC6561427.1 SirB2 family protein [Xanthomonadales bacterium]
MASHYALIKALHVHAVVLSFALFVLRAGLMLVRSPYVQHKALRYPSVLIDTVLLAAALTLSALLGQYPFVHAWLTAKVLLLVAYIVTGSYALKRGRTQRGRIIALLLALGCFGLIVAIARAHHWAGPFAASLR